MGDTQYFDYQTPVTKNPFEDSVFEYSGGSRVTASGFTESTLESTSNSVLDDRGAGVGVLFMKQNAGRNKSVQEHIVEENGKLSKLSVMESQLSHMMRMLDDIKSTRQLTDDNELTPVGEDKVQSCVSVEPNDSASVVATRMYPRKLELKKSVIAGGGESEIESTIMSKRGSYFDDVVGGYGLTAEEKIEELTEMTQVRKISGLPKIFTEERLNFLIHLHKPLFKILKSDDGYPSPDSLHKLTDFILKNKSKERTPHDDLLYQVISSTINIRRNKVKANPFNIPILEVGMHLTDKLIFMTFAELHGEYQTVWFSTVKDIEMPQFHNKYHGKVFKKVNPVNTKRKSSSILGF